MLLIIIDKLPNRIKLLSIFSERDVSTMTITVLTPNINNPCLEGVLASCSIIFGMIIDKAATSQRAGIMKIARSLNQKINAGENTSIMRSHQYSGLAAASKPYLGNNWANDNIMTNEAVNHKASSM